MRRGTQRSVVTAAALGLAAAGLLGAPPASAEPECLSSSSDFDRDGTPDVVVGVPGGSGRGGAVQVRLSNEGRPLTTTITGAPGFGTAVTSLSSYAGEGDDALCSQLVVGSPEESLRTDRQRSGVVHVYAWSSSAKRFTSRGTFAPQSQGVGGTDQSGARFGAALAAEQRPADQIDPRPARLFVGSPGPRHQRRAGHRSGHLVLDRRRRGPERPRHPDHTARRALHRRTHSRRRSRVVARRRRREGGHGHARLPGRRQGRRGRGPGRRARLRTRRPDRPGAEPGHSGSPRDGGEGRPVRHLGPPGPGSGRAEHPRCWSGRPERMSGRRRTRDR